MHDDPLDRHAELAGVDERAERGLLRRPDRVDAAVDDHRVLAAVLEQQLRGARPRHLGDAPAGAGGSDVRDGVDVRMRDERLADAPVALHEVRTPSGRWRCSASASAAPTSGLRSDGLWTTVLPVASAAPAARRRRGAGRSTA